MGVRCLACCHNADKNSCKFFVLPKDHKKLYRWKRLLSISKSLIDSYKAPRICSCHFPNHDKENEPTLKNPGRSNSLWFDYSSLKKKKKTTSGPLEEHVPLVSVPTNPRSAEPLVVTSTKITQPNAEESFHVTIDNEDGEKEKLTWMGAYNVGTRTPNDDIVTSTNVKRVDLTSTDVITQIIPNAEMTMTIDNEDVVSENLTWIELYNVATQTPDDDIVTYKSLRHCNHLMKSRIEQLEKQLMHLNLRFEFRFIESSDDKVYAHTGIASKAVFDILFETMSKIKFNYNQGWVVEKIPPKDQLLMTLMKLKLNLRYFDLAQRFGCSISTVCNIVRTWVLALHEIIFVQLMSKIPSRKKNRNCLPLAFASFEDCRAVLDATEMRCDKPNKMDMQKVTYSAYKHYNSWKSLVGMAPNGVGTFFSELYPGSVSDKRIVEHCGIIEQLHLGDLLLADKGFLIEDILPYGVILNVPPLLTTAQFTREQVRITEQIAKARVHVERLMKKIKYFEILQYIPSEMFNIATEVFQVSGYFVIRL